MKYRNIKIGLVLFTLVLGGQSSGVCQSDDDAPPGITTEKLTLMQHVMCEAIKELEPINTAIVFSINVEKVICYTTFDPVPENTVIFHNWYRRNVLNTKIKLSLRQPRWRTYSSIQLRETDKGPWRVEITDEKGRLLGLLRFSITD